jgi:hypothetical protein
MSHQIMQFSYLYIVSTGWKASRMLYDHWQIFIPETTELLKKHVLGLQLYLLTLFVSTDKFQLSSFINLLTNFKHMFSPLKCC